MAFAANIRCPLRLYAGDDGVEVNSLLAAKAKKAGMDCELVVVPGDHHEMIEPAVKQIIVWFREQATK
jgi:surfactin synthase thioesterase subunit